MKRKSKNQENPFERKLNCLLVPTDFSDSSLRTLGYAVDLATQSGGSLLLLHVVPADYGWLGIGRKELRDLDKSLQGQAANRPSSRG